MSNRIEIEGLKAVVPPIAAVRGPLTISEEELKNVVRFYKGPQLDIQKAAAVLIDIQAKCQEIRNRGQSKEDTGVEDYCVALINNNPKGTDDNPFVSAGDSLVFINIKNRKDIEVQAVPPNGFPSSSFHWPTASQLVSMAE